MVALFDTHFSYPITGQIFDAGDVLLIWGANGSRIELWCGRVMYSLPTYNPDERSICVEWLMGDCAMDWTQTITKNNNYGADMISRSSIFLLVKTQDFASQDTMHKLGVYEALLDHLLEQESSQLHSANFGVWQWDSFKVRVNALRAAMFAHVVALSLQERLRYGNVLEWAHFDRRSCV